jgi:hypothetical protein
MLIRNTAVAEIGNPGPVSEKIFAKKKFSRKPVAATFNVRHFILVLSQVFFAEMNARETKNFASALISTRTGAQSMLRHFISKK